MIPLPAVLALLALLAQPDAPVTLAPVATLGPGAGKEISGLVSSRAHPGVFWSLNDSGNEPRLYPVRPDGSVFPSLRDPKTPGVRLAGAANTDWEDLAIDGSGRLVVADTGNNANSRRDLALYILPEPRPDESVADVTTKLLVRYPDQTAFPPPESDRNFDCEAVFTVGDDIFLLSKDRSDPFTKLYRLDSRFPDQPNTLTYLDRFDAGGPVTAADASPDGLRLAVLTYGRVWLFERADARQPFFAGRVLTRPYRLPEGESDCESLCFESPDSLLIADEARRQLYRLAISELREAAPARPIPQGPVEHDLKVMSFNLRYANTGDGPNAWTLREPLVAETIAGVDPDILGVQEALAVQADWLREKLPTHTFIGVGRLDGRRAGEFAPLLVRTDRFLVLASGVFWLSETPDVPGVKGWDAACERLATWARLRDLRTKRTLLVLNTHLDHVGVQARRRGLELIRARLESLAEGADLLITGDFNTSADGPDARSLLAPPAAGADATPDRLHLLDTYRSIRPAKDAYELSFCDWKGALRGDRIDWIVASSSFTVIDAAIHRRMPTGRTPSDHYPVTAILRPR